MPPLNNRQIVSESQIHQDLQLSPDGRRLLRSEGTVPRPLAVLFLGTEVKKPAPGPWAPGPYRVTVTLRHGNETVLREERRVELR